MASDSNTTLHRALTACRGSLLWVAGFSLCLNLLMLTPALYMLQVYDRVITTGSEETLLMLTLVVVFLFLVVGGLEWVRADILVRLGNRLDAWVSEPLHAAMFRRGLGRPGGHAAWPLDDLATLRQGLAGGGLLAFFDVVWVPVYLGLLYLFDPWFGAFATFAGVMLLTLVVASEKATRGLLDAAGREQSGARELAAGNLRNAEALDAMGMLSSIAGRWLARHRHGLWLQSRASDRAALLASLTRALRLLLQSLILGLGALLVLEERITPGMMIAGSILLGRVLSPVDQLVGSWRGIVGARAAYRRLEALFREQPAAAPAMSLPPPAGRLALEAVTAGAPGGSQPIVAGVDLRLEPGEQVGIIGPSASGKSTLARLVLGIWPTWDGCVRLDGADIARWDREALGPHLGYLPQDVELFSGTIGENIARFAPVDSDQVIAAARRAGVHEMILRLPDGYDTRIEPSGGLLSAGQRQRIGLARALYGRPALVVLDEPNSNLDHRGEQALSHAMDALRREGVTLLVISHRTGVLRRVDRLLVLESGRVRLFGPRDRVLARMAGRDSEGGQAARRQSSDSEAP
ncbi:type I secretion system permease/ATPase [Halomonas nitroreducens]|uniref:Type I secretion system permease/ATPase n=1 Tax=Halomonas nitroreducens TaxID=447425 RepID=A0A3S0JUN5_9GAMM|nr:type I secretion system permease/ATPase [Halomonas nitroreducens]RTR00508.1 type I secretion system permease/ATPase [Halomonas nitroreducens]